MGNLSTLNHYTPTPAVMRMLATFDRASLEGFISVAIGLLDVVDGDPDLEANGDELDAAWIEWNEMRGHQKHGPNILAGHEDDEEDDPAGQYDEDSYTGPHPRGYGAGCSISDPGGCEHDGREPEDPI